MIEQGGAPRDAYADPDFVIVRMTAVRALGSWEAAGCFQRIAWRCERDGEWRASMQQIADEIGVSERTAKRITARLREVGWVTSERSAAYDATLTWKVVWAGQVDSANVALSVVPDEAAERAKLAPSEKARLALSSSETDETRETIETGVAEAPPTTSKSKRAHRMPEGWQPSGALKDWFRQQSELHNINPVFETEKFIDWARSANDRVGAKKDWDAAWRNWMRESSSRARPRSTGPQHPLIDDEHRKRVDGLF